MISFFILRGILERSIILSLLPASMHITARIIHFDDLTLEGAFGIGSGVMALLLSHHYSLFFSLLGSIFAGALSGLATAILHTKFYLNPLISGIITSTALFSITLKVAGAHIALPIKTAFFYNDISWIALVVFLTFFLAYLFLKTELGFLLYAVGDNQKLIIGLSKSPAQYQTIGLIIANALVGLSGALFTYYLGYFSIWSNVGMLVVALASLILAESMSNKFNFFLMAGSLLYQIIIAITYSFHIDQDWNKLITASIVVICIFIQKIFKR